MKIVSASIHSLNIPFVEAFRHSLSERDHSDSIVVKVTSDDGAVGFGEGVPRPYVTGETRDACAAHIRDHLLPAIMGVELTDRAPQSLLQQLAACLPFFPTEDAVVWNAARCAVELALIDCVCRAQGLSVATLLLPPASKSVTYSGVISGGTMGGTEALAKRCNDAGFTHVKMKVACGADAKRVAAVREILGPSVSIRLDANAAFTPAGALRFLQSVAAYGIESMEQPIPRGELADLAALRRSSPIPIMADESVVTMRDAEALIGAGAVDLFNLRLSKCGGIYPTLAIAERARDAGIGIQLGCQVGETAILSAAGRHVAAHLPSVRFVEGSYGSLLLTEDIAVDEIVFGRRGKAPLLSAPGLGITVSEALLNRYAEESTCMS
jgi:L-alanine-DL-glutamate epimerase-like enolase superfamily enzyme